MKSLDSSREAKISAKAVRVILNSRQRGRRRGREREEGEREEGEREGNILI